MKCDDIIRNEAGDPVCGHSWHLAELGTAFELHFASADELAKHGGVCAQCFVKFKKQNAGVMAGKIEEPVKITERGFLDFEHDHIAHSEDGNVESVVDFEYPDEIQVEEKARAGEALQIILAWCWTSDQITTAFRKFAVMTAAVRPDLMSDRTYRELGDLLGCTKQNISKLSTSLGDMFGFHISRNRTESSRVAMRIAQLKIHGTGTRKKRAKKSALLVKSAANADLCHAGKDK